jgi:hypothetical protein
MPRHRDTANAAIKSRTGEYAVWLQRLSRFICYLMAPNGWRLSGAEGVRCSRGLGAQLDKDIGHRQSRKAEECETNEERQSDQDC